MPLSISPISSLCCNFLLCSPAVFWALRLIVSLTWLHVRFFFFYIQGFKNSPFSLPPRPCLLFLLAESGMSHTWQSPNCRTPLRGTRSRLSVCVREFLKGGEAAATPRVVFKSVRAVLTPSLLPGLFCLPRLEEAPVSTSGFCGSPRWSLWSLHRPVCLG